MRGVVQEVLPVLLLQQPPEEGLPEVGGHLDADPLPGLGCGHPAEPALRLRRRIQPRQVQWLLREKSLEWTIVEITCLNAL